VVDEGSNTRGPGGNTIYVAMRVHISPEDLLANGAWLRRLAAHLVRGGEDADDLVQDAWVAALGAGRPPGVALIPWLGGILRNLALMRRRAGGRRAARERNVAADPALAPGGPPAPDALLERVELQRLVTDLVLALDEPTRTTVLLRYHEGLDASAIAARMDVAAGTVRWRLKQGLDTIRGGLDQRPGARGRWRALLAPAPLLGHVAAPWSPAAKGTVIAVLAAVAIATAVLFLRAPAPPATAIATAPSPPAPPTPPTPPEDEMRSTTAAAAAVSAAVALGGTPPAANATATGAPAETPTRYQIPLGSGPIAGPADAPVTMILFGGYQCPFTAAANQTLQQLLAAHPRELRLQMVQTPLPFHARSVPAARAALAAGQQGKYWDMHRRLFAGLVAAPAAGKAPPRAKLEPADLEGHARALGLDMARFQRDLSSTDVDAKLEIDRNTVESLGIHMTPTLFVNGRRLDGAPNPPDIERLVNEELRTAQGLLARGVPRDAIYNQVLATARAPGAGKLKLPSALLDQYDGVYRTGDNRLVVLERDGERLLAHRRGGPPLFLMPESDTRFDGTFDLIPADSAPRTLVNVVRDRRGQPTALDIRHPGGKLERAARVDARLPGTRAPRTRRLAAAMPRLASAASDDFESGALAGWRVDLSGQGGWFVYSNGKQAPDPATTDPRVPFDLPDPPQGRFAAVSDMNGPGTRILYRDVTLDGRYRLRATVYYVAAGPVGPPPAALMSGRAASLDDGHQLRVDLVTPTAPLDTVAPGQVLATAFQIANGDPRRRSPTPVTLDLTPWQGKTVRLRITSVDNAGPLRAAVDDVRFEKLLP
jgi:RNA polymerase sigma factor (sigma-70 family)